MDMANSLARNRPSALHVLYFAGSLRAGLYNRALLRAASEQSPQSMRVETFDLSAIPLYNGDVEARGDPEPVVAFNQAIQAADAILIATREYNYGVPGLLKNAIDWASRRPRGSPLVGKLAGICAMLQPEVLVAREHEKFDGEGRLTDETTRTFLTQFLDTFRNWVLNCRSAGR